MKFTILQQDLLPKLQSVSRSTGIRSNMPVLDNILISVEDRKLKLSATNLEIGVIKILNIEESEQGEITVPAKTIIEVISGLGQAEIKFESQGEILNITSGRFKATLNGIAATEFPSIPQSDGKGSSFSKEVFLSSSQILFACAVDEGRPQLTGLLTQIKGDILELVATDGFRLAHRKVKLEDNPADVEDFKALIPKKTFEEVLKVLSEEEVDLVSVSIADKQNQIIFNLGNTTISSRLIEGSFPSWEKIMPEKFITRVILEKDDILRALKLASVIAKNEANIVNLTINKDQLTIKSVAKELGTQQNEIEGTIEGEEMEIAFNAKFLIDAISASPTTQVILEFSGPLSSTLIKPVGVEGLEYVVMPVRTS